MIEQFMSRQFINFLLTGGTAAAVNFFTRIIYSQWLGFSASVLLAYVTGMITAYILARMFVFRGSKQTLQLSMMFFVLVNLLAIAQTWAVSLVMAYHALPAIGVERFTLEIAHAIGIIVPVFTSFLGHKYWSFR